MSDNEKDEDWKKVERVLGEPVFDDFSENTLRIRRNLLIVSSLALAYKLNGLTVSPDSSLFGVKFEGLTNGVIDQTFFWLIMYHLVHFGWNSVVNAQSWRIRVTGTVLAHQTGSMYTSEHGDYPGDPRQSSLNKWWSNQARQIGNIGNDARELQEKIKVWELSLKQLPDSIAKQNIQTNVPQQLSDINNHASSLASKVEVVNKTLSSTRIPVSLNRFEKWFSLFQWNQLIKWAFIEWIGPIVIGLWAVWMIYPYNSGGTP